MKKWIASLLVLTLALTMSMGAFAESVSVDELLDQLTPEQKNELLVKLLQETLEEVREDKDDDDDEKVRAAAAPAYKNFSEHLASFAAKTLNLEYNDLELGLNTPAGIYNVILGKTAEGFFAELMSNDSFMGKVEITEDAALLFDGKNVMGVKFDELKKLLDNFQAAQDASNPALQLIDKDKLSQWLKEDTETCMNWLTALWNEVQPAFVTESIENGTRVTLNAPLFAEKFIACLNEILDSPEFATIWTRYTQLAATSLKAQPVQGSVGSLNIPSAAEISSSFDLTKEQLAAMLSQIELAVEMTGTNGAFNLSLDATVPTGDDKLAVNAAGTVSLMTMSAAGSLTAARQSAPEAPVFTAEANIGMVGANQVKGHCATTSNGQTYEIDLDIGLPTEQNGQTITYAQTISLNGIQIGRESCTLTLAPFALDAQIEHTLPAAFSGHVTFQNGILTIEWEQNGQKLNAQITCEEVSADLFVLYVNAEINGKPTGGNISFNLLPTDPEDGTSPDMLLISVFDNSDPENALGSLYIAPTPRSDDPSLAEGEVQWYDAETLQMMLTMLLSSLQPQQAVPQQ